ncbi:vWA domain-containing protein [Pollutibacter soli]|uniref:vWA domain-containing protein n=1 Tax=Pollutibacter soli TaxID=3034157 RepID=UPI003013FA2E
MICALLLCCTLVHAQYYIRGEVKDNKKNPLQNARIIVHSTRLPYNSGVGGAFGILSSVQKDTLTFQLDGYEPFTVPVDASKYLEIELKMLPFTASLYKHTRLSITRNKQLRTELLPRFVGGETYNMLVENEFINTQQFPQTGLVLNVDRASYSNVRRFVNLNSEVPPDAVRIEEMLNYFSLNFNAPGKDSVFRVSSNLTSCPWNPNNQLFYLFVNTKKINLDAIPPSNLVFLVDVSGSMDMPNRLPLLKTAFRKLVDNLRAIDTISIVVYGSVTGVMLQPTGGDNKKVINDAIEQLEPGGNTPGEAGILQAYALARNKFIKGGNNRVILATDGDFNVGQFSEKDLEALITKQKQSGVYLTCLGVGMGNYKDSKIEILAKTGNGNFAYLDNEMEAEKVLVKELTQTLYTVADDVYMNVNFNPSLVSSYRLIGFDNKLSALTDSTSNLEGGEVGSGHSMIAIFEVVPTVENVKGVVSGIMKDHIADVEIRYRLPGNKSISFFKYRSPFNFLEFAESEHKIRFAATVALFGQMLRSSEFVKNVTWDQLVVMARDYSDHTNPSQREFAELVLKAQKLYVTTRKKK